MSPNFVTIMKLIKIGKGNCRHSATEATELGRTTVDSIFTRLQNRRWITGIARDTEANGRVKYGLTPLGEEKLTEALKPEVPKRSKRVVAYSLAGPGVKFDPKTDPRNVMKRETYVPTKFVPPRG